MKTKKIISALVLSALSVATQAGGFRLYSSLPAGNAIPANYYWNNFGCSGQNQSPELHWENAPSGTKSFAITFYDRDAPTGSGFWHYVAYNLPVGTDHIDIGELAGGKLPVGTVEGNTDLGKPGFLGPCPPVGRAHNYVYTVHALKVEKLEVPANATAALTNFFFWQNSLGKAEYIVKAGPRQ